MSHTKTGFIGAGRLATALAVALHAAGYEIAAIVSRSPASASRLAGQFARCRAADHAAEVFSLADIVFLAVPDDLIAGIVASVNPGPDTAIVHCSGALGLDVLDAARNAGAAAGCFHPFLSIQPGENRKDIFADAVIGIEAEGDLFKELQAMAAALGAIPLDLHGVDRRAYHAAGAFTANFLVTLVAAAAQLWKDAGLHEELAAGALGRLAGSVAESIREQGIAQSLTGPIARGDIGTVQRHLDYLDARQPDLAFVYRTLGHHTVALARESGRISGNRAEAMHRLLG